MQVGHAACFQIGPKIFRGKLNLTATNNYDKTDAQQRFFCPLGLGQVASSYSFPCHRPV
jgi:hypothetical protein